MTKPKGGRGHLAPYETTHVRVPLPIKDQVDRLVEQYRDKLTENGTPKTENQNKNNSSKSLAEAVEISKELLKHKKSAKTSLAKLLTFLYGEEVKPQDLAD